MMLARLHDQHDFPGTVVKHSNIAFAYIDSWNGKDVEEIYAFFHEEAVYIDTTLERELIGEAIRSHIIWITEICPDIRFEIVDGTNITKGRCAVEWLAYGTNLEPFCTGTRKSQGEPILGLDFIRFKEDKIISTHVYFDQAHRNPEIGIRSSFVDNYQKYEKSGLTEDDLLRHKLDLEVLMVQKKIYLDSDLTLSRLANHMNISINHLSQVINKKFEMNFYDFINHYRVNEALLQFNDKNAPVKSALDIAFEVGFGSSSSFYHAFKKITGLTPTQYRKAGPPPLNRSNSPQNRTSNTPQFSCR